MPEFVFAYHMTGQPTATPEEGAELMAKWQARGADNSAALTHPGNPAGLAPTPS